MPRVQRNKTAEELKQEDLEQIEEELTEGVEPIIASEDEEEVVSLESTAPKKRGRPKIPLQWSRVMHVKQGEEVKLETRRIDFELDLAKNLSRPDPDRRESDWELLFYPKQFALEHDIEETEGWVLPEVMLKRYAHTVNELRKK
jgi:hypothetical protein